jgi:hypothetical protein
MYPRSGRWKPSVLLMGLLLLAGCGGGGGTKPKPAPVKVVATAGAHVSVPNAWVVSRTPTTASASPKAGSDELVSVSIFRLLRPYSAALWTRVVPELDRAAQELARELKATVDASRTVTVGGEKARQYDLSFTRAGRQLHERLTFVLRGRREYQLLCRWGATEPAACGSLESSFAFPA